MDNLGEMVIESARVMGHSEGVHAATRGAMNLLGGATQAAGLEGARPEDAAILAKYPAPLGEKLGAQMSESYRAALVASGRLSGLLAAYQPALVPAEAPTASPVQPTE